MERELYVIRSVCSGPIFGSSASALLSVGAMAEDSISEGALFLLHKTAYIDKQKLCLSTNNNQSSLVYRLVYIPLTTRDPSDKSRVRLPGGEFAFAITFFLAVTIERIEYAFA